MCHNFKLKKIAYKLLNRIADLQWKEVLELFVYKNDLSTINLSNIGFKGKSTSIVLEKKKCIS